MARSINDAALAAHEKYLEGAVTSGTTDAGAGTKVSGVFNTTRPTYTTGQRTDIQTDNRGAVFATLANGGTQVGVSSATITGTLSASTAGLAVANHNYKSNGTAWRAESCPSAVSRIPSAAASTNATVAKASAGDIHRVTGYNDSAGLRYLKLYNKATAPTVGTDTPILTLALEAHSAFNIEIGGYYCSAGIAYALTTGAADADTAAVTAADIVGLNVLYA